MLFVMQRKSRTIPTLFLVCMVVLMLIGCKVHAILFAPEQATPPGQGHCPATGGPSCLLAVLPVGVWLIVFAFFLFSADFRLLRPTALASVLFKPPKYSTH
jgi:hypothetical protein